MIQNSTGLAFFDLDGTITRRDTFLAFIRFTHGMLRFWMGMLWLSPYLVAYFLGVYDNTKLKERCFAHFYKGCNAKKLRTKGNAFALQKLPLLCRPGALAVLEAHEKAGNMIFILTASPALWTEAWCQARKYQLISSQFEVIDGQFTGLLHGPNCYGETKAERMKIVLEEFSNTIVYAHGDHPSDCYFLQLADHAYHMPLSWKNIKHAQILPLL